MAASLPHAVSQAAEKTANSGTGSGPGSSPSQNNAPVASAVVASPLILQIRVLEGDEASYAAGSRAIKGITVEITDEAGQPVAGTAVSFRLPEDGASGLFSNGTRTEIAVTGAAGRAAVWGMKWNRATGPVVIRVTAAKGETRAGALVRQTLVEPSAAASTGGPVVENRRVRIRAGNRRAWISAIAAAAAGGGIVLGVRGGSKSSSSTPASTGAGAVTIGSPSIVVGPGK